MRLTVAEWSAAAAELHAAGLDDLADLYTANARRVRDGEPIEWPPPAHIRVSAHIAAKPEPPAFECDGRESQ